MDIKVEALIAAELSSTTPENKISIASAAIREGLNIQTSDIVENTKLSKLRLNAIYMMISNHTASEEVVPIIEKTVRLSYDEYEVLTAVYALGLNGTDAAVAILGELLGNYNKRQISGLGVENPRLLSAVIQALGLTKNPKA